MKKKIRKFLIQLTANMANKIMNVIFDLDTDNFYFIDGAYRRTSLEEYLEFLWDESKSDKNILDDKIMTLEKFLKDGGCFRRKIGEELIKRKISLFNEKINKRIKRKEKLQRRKEKKHEEQSKIKVFIRIKRPQAGEANQLEVVKKVWNEREEEKKEEDWEEEILFQIKK
jgi:hypothetical protein